MLCVVMCPFYNVWSNKCMAGSMLVRPWCKFPDAYRRCKFYLNKVVWE